MVMVADAGREMIQIRAPNTALIEGKVKTFGTLLLAFTRSRIQKQRQALALSENGGIHLRRPMARQIRTRSSTIWG